MNGFHIFLQERRTQSEESIEGVADADVFLRQGSYDWSLLSAEAKQEYGDKAKAANAEREALKASDAPTMASLPGGPWNLSNLGSGESSSWPLRVDVMERFLETHGFEPIATEWVKDQTSSSCFVFFHKCFSDFLFHHRNSRNMEMLTKSWTPCP